MLTDIPPALQTALRVGAEVETVFAQREAGLYRDGVRSADGALSRCKTDLASTLMCRRCWSVMD